MNKTKWIIENILRYLIILLSIIFLAIGIVILVGAIKFLKSENYEQEQGAAVAWMGVVQGSLSILLPIFGFCGAKSRDRNNLNTFAVGCLILFIFHVSYTVYSVKKYAEVGDNKDKFIEKIQDEFEHDVIYRGKLFTFQKDHECCGITGTQDYVHLNRDLSPTCCPETDNKTAACTDKAFKKACGDELFDEYLKEFEAIDFAKILTFILLVFCFVLAGFLANYFYSPGRRPELDEELKNRAKQKTINAAKKKANLAQSRAQREAQLKAELAGIAARKEAKRAKEEAKLAGL